jgi:hypothetical protein
MEHNHHYKVGERGRSLSMDPRSGVRSACVTCTECGEVGNVSIVKLMPPEVIDKKFTQRGWQLDPHKCPMCIAEFKKAKQLMKKERLEMNTTTVKASAPLADNPVLKAVSVDTHKATAKMHRLLAEHFDGDEGRFSEGWDDERIAKESGMSVTHVAEVRSVAYGDIKEPEEITLLRKDIKALNDLIGETLIAAQKEVNALNKRVAEICAKLGIKP